MEPLMILRWAELNHPAVTAVLRDFDMMTVQLADALDPGPYLLGDRFTAADMLCSSPFHWFLDMTPDVPAIRRWVELCAARMQK